MIGLGMNATFQKCIKPVGTISTKAMTTLWKTTIDEEGESATNIRYLHSLSFLLNWSSSKHIDVLLGHNAHQFDSHPNC